MTTQEQRKSQVWYIDKRASLLAQEFLLDLGSDSISEPGFDFGLDLLAVFRKGAKGTVIVGIIYKGTEQEINHRYRLPLEQLESISHMNLPTLLLAIDVKRNEVYFEWAKRLQLSETDPRRQQHIVTVSLRKSDAEAIEMLKKEILSLGD